MLVRLKTKNRTIATFLYTFYKFDFISSYYFSYKNNPPLRKQFSTKQICIYLPAQLFQFKVNKKLKMNKTKNRHQGDKKIKFKSL